MIFEVINMSDRVTVEADLPLVAALAALLAGEGWYGLHDENNLQVLPILALGGEEGLVHWVEQQGFEDGKIAFQKHRTEIIACLRTACIGSAGDRRVWMAKLGRSPTMQEMRARNKTLQTSLTDICGSCYDMADALEPGHG